MLNSFNEKLDRTICFISIGCLTALIITVAASDLYSLFDMSGVFKQ